MIIKLCVTSCNPQLCYEHETHESSPAWLASKATSKAINGEVSGGVTLKFRDMRMLMMARQPMPIQMGPLLSFQEGHS